ncbi:ABC transporter permease subunit [Chloroflexota bacterium]
MALALLETDQKREAVAKLTSILRENRANELAWYLLGHAVKDPTNKIYAFRRVLRLNPSHIKAAIKLRKLLGERKQPFGMPFESTWINKFKSTTGYRISSYILVRAITILATISVGVFITIMVANSSGQIDGGLKRRIETKVRHEYMSFSSPITEQQMQEYIRQAEEEAGLHLPHVLRQLKWTYNALMIDWGEISYTEIQSSSWDLDRSTVKEVILDRLPNTLLLVGVSYLLIFIIGVPLALSVSRKHGGWQDKILSFLAPLSSIPSWVYGVLFVLVFAVEIRLLPLSGMYGGIPQDAPFSKYLNIAKHMVLPVSAIVVSLLFQLAYAWRTFFLIYANEDYVELAKAKGLTPKQVEQKYILRPTYPYVITSFTLTLVSFWQTTTALEVVFDWPGIGRLYINSLPNFFGESMYPGEMAVSVAIVVLFAYLLGIIIFVLDLVYVLLDPRVRIGMQDQNIDAVSTGINWRRMLWALFKTVDSMIVGKQGRSPKQFRKSLISNKLLFFKYTLKHQISSMLSIGRDLLRYPSAVFGTLIIILLVGGSIFAIVAFPYNQIGDQWYSQSFTGKVDSPRLASPLWVNNFRKGDLLSTLVRSTKDGQVERIFGYDNNGGRTVSIRFDINYFYDRVPEEISLYFEPQYKEKRPFISMVWITPKGDEIKLKNFGVETTGKLDLLEYLARKQGALGQSIPGESSELETDYGNPEFFQLFSDSESGTVNQGIYQLAIDARLFEPDADLDVELVMLGQVYGLAGTDIYRRDLLIPLLWGMPFALAFGLMGAVVTSLISMAIAATGVWFGGWVDTLLQRLTEANMIIPVLAISVLMYAFFNVSIWTILGIIVVLNVFSGPAKSFRAAFLQIKEAPYIEAAKTYGAKNSRVIFVYMVPRIIPVLIPQLVALIPSYVFLEATLGMFNIKSDYPTWGRIIYEALKHGVGWGSRYWVLQPIGLLLLTGFSFALVGFALDRILNPKLKGV